MSRYVREKQAAGRRDAHLPIVPPAKPVALAKDRGQFSTKSVTPRDLVGPYTLQRIAQRCCPDERFKNLRGCRDGVRTTEQGGGRAGLHYVPSEGRAFWSGLCTCGSAWVCPPCAEAIWNYRQTELGQALKKHRGAGGRVLFITLTASHHHDDLGVMLDALIKAVGKVYTGGAFTRFKKSLGYIGSIRGVEVTWSYEHGWHPHFHVLWFLGALTPGQLAEVTAYVDTAWRAALVTLGLSGSEKHACKVRDTSWTIEEYMTKMGKQKPWDADAELTMGNRKHGRRGGFSPQDLLRIAGGLQMAPKLSARRAGFLYHEYACATQGHQSFRWSPGLRELLGMGAAKKDEAIAAAEDIEHEAEVDELLPANVQVASFSPAAYHVVTANDARGELVAELVACRGDVHQLRTFLEALGLRCSWRDAVVWAEAP